MLSEGEIGLKSQEKSSLNSSFQDSLQESLTPKQDSPIAVVQSQEDTSSKVNISADTNKGVRVNIKRFLFAGLGTIAIISGTISGISHFSGPAAVSSPAVSHVAAAVPAAVPLPPPVVSVASGEVEPIIPENYASLPKAEAMNILKAKEAWLTKQIGDKSASAAQLELNQDKLEVLHSMMAAL